MLVSGTKRETLPVEIARDASSGLPLLTEQQGIFNLVLAYLALPFSVAEYGCGKKTSLILDFLLSLNIPPYALNRGLIMERDMSPEALAETDAGKRRHALVLENPLFHLGDLRDPRLQEMLLEACPGVEVKDGEILAGSYVLHHERFVQFVIARTHVFAELTFWDESRGRAVRRVIDPTVETKRPFRIRKMREYMNAPDALIFRAPLLGSFRLDRVRLTLEQEHHISELLDDGRQLKELTHDEHADLVRRLCGAERGSLGDPLTWTYANNIRSEQLIRPADPEPYRERDRAQKRETRRTGELRELTTQLIKGREARGDEVPVLRAELDEVINEADVRRIVREDARWSEKELQSLADVAGTMVYYRSLGVMARILRADGDLLHRLDDLERVEALGGTGVRLRRRIDLVARVSLEEDGRIDARALRPGFTRATVETIRQMNRAGLTVFVDRVGNCHGILLDPASRERLREPGISLEDVAPARIAHGSHIDTVNDAGKFDGRLGVLSGLETAHVLRDLHHYHGLFMTKAEAPVRLQVSAYIGEEMTFTGEGVSMPGSAAVAGRATPERIYAMRNVDGERFHDLLLPFLAELRERQAAGEIDLFNDLAGATDDGALLAACSDPTDFFTPHTYERHIEQGPVLDRDEVPIVLVDTIMGIYQEDFHFVGPGSESAALALNGHLRRLALEFLEAGDDVRVTVGILEGDHSDPTDPASPSEVHEELCFALACALEGELNHAGATPTMDRRDPGVAAARLAGQFLEWVDELNGAGRTLPARPIVGNVRLLPGTNRNVIPGEARFSLAIAGQDALSERESEDLQRRLEAFAAGTLARSVAGSGEGINVLRMEPVSFVRSSSRARLSLDLRSAQEEITARFVEHIGEVCARVAEEFGVEIQRAVQQELAPQLLEATGQVLMMERSYGGSHNPRETELLNDIVRGSVLQTAVSCEIARLERLPPDFNLFTLVERRFPAGWLERRRRFVSGALHDTCNIAARTKALRSSVS